MFLARGLTLNLNKSYFPLDFNTFQPIAYLALFLSTNLVESLKNIL